jgi:hypothetical protein
MTAKQTAAYSGGGLLLLAWLASASGLVPQPPPLAEHQTPVETSGTASLAADVHAQAERLKTRMASAPAPQSPTRNPFVFVAREAPARRERPVLEAAAPVVEPGGAPDEPAIDLVGLAEDQTPKGPQRTAIISALSGELFMVKEGELIAARYRVKAIGKDAVELTDLVSGATRRLALRE